jgi:hypothetical protein
MNRWLTVGLFVLLVLVAAMGLRNVVVGPTGQYPSVVAFSSAPVPPTPWNSASFSSAPVPPTPWNR